MAHCPISWSRGVGAKSIANWLLGSYGSEDRAIAVRRNLKVFSHKLCALGCAVEKADKNSLQSGISGVRWRLTKKFTRYGGIGIIFAMLIVRSESVGIRSKVPGGASRKVLSSGIVQGFAWSKALVGMVTTTGGDHTASCHP